MRQRFALCLAALGCLLPSVGFGEGNWDSGPEWSYSEDARIEDLLDFIEDSPEAWHAVWEAAWRLEEQGFVALDERDHWQLEAGGKYYVTRNGSSIVAFVLPQERPSSIRILGAHTDSPGLKIKPNGEYAFGDLTMLSPEYYGGPTLPTFFGRPLRLAGRIVVRDWDGEISTQLVMSEEPVAIIPPLAIHLDSAQLKTLEIDPQAHLAAIVALNESDEDRSVSSWIDELLREELDYAERLGSELYLCPAERPQLLGAMGNLIHAGRQDNLLGTHASLCALIDAQEPALDRIRVIACWDNEEIGSETMQGAASTFLPDVLERIMIGLRVEGEQRLRLLRNTLLISNDVAHAVHPNYAGKHEPKHQVRLGGGVVLKINAQQHYATSAETQAVITDLCEAGGIPLQSFVARTDMRCGSTIGPIVATRLGIATVDIGEPLLGMHSALELGSCHDHLQMIRLLTAVLED